MAGFPITNSNALGITIDPSLLSQPSTPDSAMSSDIPLEPTSEEWPQDAMADIALHLSDTQSFEATQSAFPSLTTHLFDLDVQIRAHSQPPEDLYQETSPAETRHPRDPRHSRRPCPPAQSQYLRPDPRDPRFRRASCRPSHQLSRSTSCLEVHRPRSGHRPSTHRPPYGRLHRPQAPTSTPSVLPNAPFLIRHPWTETTSTFPTFSSLMPQNASPSDYPDLPIPPQRSPHTSFSLHLESHLAHLQRVISSMQAYLSQSYKSPDDDDERAAVESSRLLARSVNRTLTELDEPLVTLPRQPESTASEQPVPATAAEIRELHHTTIDPLLDSYNIAFTPMMFLWEKKAIYLRFIGAGRALMHRVLD